jgi:hypothetical protein
VKYTGDNIDTVPTRNKRDVHAERAWGYSNKMKLLAVGQEGGDVGDPLVPSCPRFSEIVQKKTPASILI